MTVLEMSVSTHEGRKQVCLTHLFHSLAEDKSSVNIGSNIAV